MTLKISAGILMLGAAVVVGFGSTACGGDNADVAAIETPPPAAASTAIIASGSSTGSGVPATAPTLSPSATSTVQPPDGNRLRISRILVDAAIVAMEVNQQGQLAEETPDEVVLQDFSTHWPDLGGLPGDGNTVLTGKLDSGRVACKGGTIPPPCEAVFWELKRLAEGDTVEVYWSGQRHDYRVISTCVVSAADGPWDEIVAKPDSQLLTLITAAGPFVNGSYVNRLVVTAGKDASVSVPWDCPE